MRRVTQWLTLLLQVIMDENAPDKATKEQSLRRLRGIAEQSGQPGLLRLVHRIQFYWLTEQVNHASELAADCQRLTAFAEQLLAAEPNSLLAAAVLGELARLARRQGDLGRALDLLQDSLRIYEGLGDQAAVVDVHIQIGDLNQSRKCYNESLISYQIAGMQAKQHHFIGLLARAKLKTGMVLHQKDQKQEASRNYIEALAYYLKASDTEGQLGCYRQMATLAESEGNLQEALDLFLKIQEMAAHSQEQLLMARSCLDLTRIQRRLGRLESARDACVQGQRLLEGTKEHSWRAIAYCEQGDLERQMERPEAARLCYEMALKIYLQIGARPLMILPQIRIGDLAANQGAYEDALKWYRHAAELSRALNDKYAAEMVNNRLNRLQTATPTRN